MRPITLWSRVHVLMQSLSFNRVCFCHVLLSHWLGPIKNAQVQIRHMPKKHQLKQMIDLDKTIKVLTYSLSQKGKPLSIQKKWTSQCTQSICIYIYSPHAQICRKFITNILHVHNIASQTMGKVYFETFQRL